MSVWLHAPSLSCEHFAADTTTTEVASAAWSFTWLTVSFSYQSAQYSIADDDVVKPKNCCLWHSEALCAGKVHVCGFEQERIPELAPLMQAGFKVPIPSSTLSLLFVL